MFFQRTKIGCLIFSFLLAVVTPALLYGAPSDTVKLFYDINQYKLDSVNKSKLNGLKAKIRNHPYKVTVLGYADYLGNPASNLTLSYNRAKEVKGYLSGPNIKVVIAVKGIGEVEYRYEKSAVGNAPDRKVEVIAENDSLSNQKVTTKIVDALPPIITPYKNGSETRISSKSTFLSTIDSLSTLRIGSSITLKELVFFPGRHVLMPRSIPYLDSLAAYFYEHPNLTFRIVGHVCCDFEYRDGYDLDGRKYDLSVERARYICVYLSQNGVDGKRMKYIGLGSTAPKVFPERTPKDEELNRRVEIVIESK